MRSIVAKLLEHATAMSVNFLAEERMPSDAHARPRSDFEDRNVRTERNPAPTVLPNCGVMKTSV